MSKINFSSLKKEMPKAFRSVEFFIPWNKKEDSPRESPFFIDDKGNHRVALRQSVERDSNIPSSFKIDNIRTDIIAESESNWNLWKAAYDKAVTEGYKAWTRVKLDNSDTLVWVAPSERVAFFGKIVKVWNPNADTKNYAINTKTGEPLLRDDFLYKDGTAVGVPLPYSSDMVWVYDESKEDSALPYEGVVKEDNMDFSSADEVKKQPAKAVPAKVVPPAAPTTPAAPAATVENKVPVVNPLAGFTPEQIKALAALAAEQVK